MFGSVTCALTGAMTRIEAVLIALLNGRSTVGRVSMSLKMAKPESTPIVPLTGPFDRSQGRKVRPADTVPVKFIAGTNRTRLSGSALKTTADFGDRVPKLIQLLPPLVENCHTPLLLSAPVMATPKGRAAFGAATKLRTKDNTESPLLLESLGLARTGVSGTSTPVFNVRFSTHHG